MIIYVNKEDMRSYALTQNVVWDTISVEVSDDFVGGAKTYDLESNTWIDDPPLPPPTDEEIKQRAREEIEQRIQFLRGEIIYLTVRGKDTSEVIREIEECEGKLEELLKEM